MAREPYVERFAAPRRFELRITGPSTTAEVRQCPDAPDYLDTSDDGSASVYVDGELVAVSDEYATAYLAAGSNPWPSKGTVERFLAAGLEFYGEATAASLPLPQEERDHDAAS